MLSSDSQPDTLNDSAVHSPAPVPGRVVTTGHGDILMNTSPSPEDVYNLLAECHAELMALQDLRIRIETNVPPALQRFQNSPFFGPLARGIAKAFPGMKL